MDYKRSGMFALILSIVVSFTLVLPSKAQGFQETAIVMSAEAGFDGLYKGEFWLPVHVNVANEGPPVEGELRIVVGESTGRNRVVYSAPITLPTQSNKRQTIYVFLPSIISDLTVDLIDSKGTAVVSATTNRLERLTSNDLFYGVLSSEPDELAILQEIKGTRSDAAVAFLDLDDLPHVATVWGALDVLVLHDADSGRLNQLQRQAMEDWLSTGGQLVVTGGPEWQRSTAAIAELLPVSISGTESIADLPGLSATVGTPFRDPGPYLVSTSSLRRGALLLHEGGLPILARAGYGLGNVYFLALDPNLAPLKDWDGTKMIWEEIATLVPRQPPWAVGARNSFAASSAVSSLPALALPSALGLIAFLFIYVLIVGPINYLVLRKWGRREIAWLTVPGIVLFFSIIAYIVGFQLKGNDTIVNQMSIVYGSVIGPRFRTQTILGLYSPRRATFDMTLPGNTPIRPFDQGFGALSGAGNIDRVEQGQDTVVREVRVDVSDIETLVADSYQPALSITGHTSLRLDGNELLLDVTVQNNGDFELEDASILVGGMAVAVGDIGPGEVKTLAPKISPASSPTAAFTGSGMSAVYVGSPPVTSPLAANYTTILGSTSYYNDAKLYPRWQLLESLSADYGSSPAYYPSGTATLIAWSEEKLLNITLDKREFDNQATTLYFLELPLDQNVVSGQGVTIPAAMLDWQVLDQRGVYDPKPNDLYLPPGWVEFEYLPWSAFQSMEVTGLAVSLNAISSVPGQLMPVLRIWDWGQESWITLEVNDWGRITVEEYDLFLGPGNTIRLRLQNDNQQGMQIAEIYPELTGNLP